DEAFARATAFLPVRRVLTALALFGVGETTFLTATKAFSTPAAICGTRGCVDVLSGPYSSFLGIPLSLFGVLSYGAFAALAGWPLAAPPTSPAFVRRDAATRPLMVLLSAAMAAFSAYLLTLLAVVIRSPCAYCLTSAGVCAALFLGTALIGRAVPDAGATARLGGAGAVAAAALSGVMFLSTPVQARPPSAPPPITTVSERGAMRLAKRLEEQGATMFGAYWCSHCYAQKQLFGEEAFARIRYVECAKDGAQSQSSLCREKKVPGYPTWEINGALYPGEMDLADLQNIVDGKKPPTYFPEGAPAAATK
ncbi:hypothetical protein BU14_2518s0001, partial [Porphyra umbilicalis]